MTVRYWDRKKDDWVERDIDDIPTDDLHHIRKLAIRFRDQLDQCNRQIDLFDNLMGEAYRKGVTSCPINIKMSSPDSELSYRIIPRSIDVECMPFPDDLDFDTFRGKDRNKLNKEIIDMALELEKRGGRV